MDGDPGVLKTTAPATKKSQRGKANAEAKCTQEACVVTENEEHTFQCFPCKRFVHYRCTGLPLYQIQQFNTKNYRNFYCSSCVQIPEHLKNIIPHRPLPAHSKEAADLSKKLKDKQTEIDSLAGTNRILQEQIRKLSEELSSFKEVHESHDETIHNLNTESKLLKSKLKDSNTKYEQEISKLKNDLANKQDIPCQTTDNLTAITNLFCEKFKEVEENLKRSILDEVSNNQKMLEDKINEVVVSTSSYAAAAKNQTENSSAPKATISNVPDLREIMRHEHNEQLAEDAEKKRRACNLVIHGFAESTSDDTEERKKFDDELVKSFIRDIGTEVAHKSVFRLGKRDTDKVRPLKISMNNEMDKETIMSNLKNLKDQEKYARVSVTDDHTINERKLIKDMIDQVEKANAKEPVDSKFIWKLRGSPKNGLSLKKFRKRNEPNH